MSELHGPRLRLRLGLYAVGLVLRRLLTSRLAVRRVLLGLVVQRVLVRAHLDHAERQPQQQPHSRGHRSAVTVGAACALAFLAALPQLCSP
jgi:hypothetical protein